MLYHLIFTKIHLRILPQLSLQNRYSLIGNLILLIDFI